VASSGTQTGTDMFLYFLSDPLFVDTHRRSYGSNCNGKPLLSLFCRTAGLFSRPDPLCLHSAKQHGGGNEWLNYVFGY
jgi:hypothetical protein